MNNDTTPNEIEPAIEAWADALLAFMPQVRIENPKFDEPPNMPEFAGMTEAQWYVVKQVAMDRLIARLAPADQHALRRLINAANWAAGVRAVEEELAAEADDD